MRYILWFWQTKDSWPPPLFAFITLITYHFSLLPFACLACLCASLYSRTLVCTFYPTRCVDLSTYVILSFCDFFLVYCLKSHQSFFTKVFSIPPPVSCLSLFTFHSTLHPSWLPSAACFTCLFAFCLCGFPAVAVQVSWTEGVLCPVRYSSWG